MTVFNEDRYLGLARTEFVLDAASVTQTTLNSLVTNTGGATATVQANLTIAGGRILLSATTPGARSVLTLPPVFGNATGSLRAWRVDVEGLFCNTFRPNFKVLASNNTAETAYTGLRWDELGVHVVSKTSAGAELLQTAKAGNFSEVTNTSLGFFTDYTSPSNTSLNGHFGFCKVGIFSGVSVAGTYGVRLTNESTTAYPNSVVGFSKLRLTCFWGSSGDKQTKTY